MTIVPKVALLRTAMDDAMRVVEIGQARDDCEGDFAEDVDVDRSVFAIDVIEGAAGAQLRYCFSRPDGAPLVHEFHANSP
jgi:hypothetical protein